MHRPPPGGERSEAFPPCLPNRAFSLPPRCQQPAPAPYSAKLLPHVTSDYSRPNRMAVSIRISFTGRPPRTGHVDHGKPALARS